MQIVFVCLFSLDGFAVYVILDSHCFMDRWCHHYMILKQEATLTSCSLLTDVISKIDLFIIVINIIIIIIYLFVNVNCDFTHKALRTRFNVSARSTFNFYLEFGNVVVVFFKGSTRRKTSRRKAEETRITYRVRSGTSNRATLFNRRVL